MAGEFESTRNMKTIVIAVVVIGVVVTGGVLVVLNMGGTNG